jgi:hypothetical protein
MAIFALVLGSFAFVPQTASAVANPPIDSCDQIFEYTKTGDFDDSRVNINFEKNPGNLSFSNQIDVSAKNGYVITKVELDVEDDNHQGLWTYATNAVNNFNPNPGDKINSAKITVKKVCDKVTICHATGNGFIVNEPNKTADAGGHAGLGHQDGEDIIPPFDYEAHANTPAGHFDGQNWDAEGQAIWNDGECDGTYTPPTCPDGYTGTYPNCVPPPCPTDYTGEYPNCVPPPCPAEFTGTFPNCVPPPCPTDYTGTYPNCVPPPCPTDYTGEYPNCVPPPCPAEFTGTFPNCVPPPCPTDYIGEYPECVPPPCPAEFTGTFPNCVPPPCPTDYTGEYPNCVPPPCPTDYTGTYPNCVPPPCPTDYTGTYPNCVPPVDVCPTDYTGEYPNCVPPPCPTDYTGTYPNCVPPVDVCPDGYTGQYPVCIPPAQDDECEIEGHKYTLDSERKAVPLSDWVIGLMKIRTYEDESSNTFDLAYDITDKDGYYCLEWDGEAGLPDGEETTPYKSFVYYVYEVLVAGWTNISIEKGVDVPSLAPVPDTEILETPVDRVSTQVFEENGYLPADTAYHVDFYNTQDGDSNTEDSVFACTITASKNPVEESEDFTITWTSTLADSVTLNGNSVELDGSLPVDGIDGDTLYTLIAYDNSEEDSVECTVTVQIDEDGGSNGGGSSSGSRKRSSGGSSSNEPVGEVLGESTSILPVGAPNTGAGGTSSSPIASFVALFGMLMSLVTLRVTKNG